MVHSSTYLKLIPLATGVFLLLPILILATLITGVSSIDGNRKAGLCNHAKNKNLCLPKSYSKFELPFTETVNVVEIGIDILDVLRINDKVSCFFAKSVQNMPQ